MKRYAVFLILFMTAGLWAQNKSWTGYFSYNEIRDLSQSPTAFFAAAENAIFSKRLTTNSVKTINTVDGLSGMPITAIHHSPALNKTMVGYENGLLIVINEADGSMLNVVDIINKQLPSQIKRVNHFMEHEGIVYVSCDFGMVQYNLATNGFGDTYFIGDNGAEIRVSQSTVFDGQIFAATDFGIRRAAIDNPNLNDFSQWTTVTTGTWKGVEAFGNELLAVNSTSQVVRYNGAVFNNFLQMPEQVLDFRAAGDYFLITMAGRCNVYNSSLASVAQIFNWSIPETGIAFTCATSIGQILYIGTREHGVMTTSVSNPSVFENLLPAGPQRNSVFSINTETPTLWAVFGDYTGDYDPDPLRTYGVSKFNQDGWTNLKYSDIKPPDREVYDLVRVTVNPKNHDEVYISSYHSGLLKLEGDSFAALYDHTNSGLESLFLASAPNYKSVRIEQSAFDRNGVLWMSNGLIANGIKALKPDGNWTSVNIENAISAFFDSRIGRLSIDKNGTKWYATNMGVLAYNENGNTFKMIKMGDGSGNLPIDDVRVVEIDNRNQLWIGTSKGLRILSSVDRFKNEGQMNTNSIIIVEDGLAQELMYEQSITDIATDGANNKWIGTADSGVFLVSPNGQETIHHFTTTNSPLPSNTINDIGINGATGEVFFATDRGMVSFRGISTDPNDNLSNVFVYPNPVRPNYAGTVKISGLMDRCNVKITDIEGNLVHEEISQGGTMEWDTTAFGKYRVASGVYMIFISSEDAAETKVKKVMIVR
jgi:hypothetical protein